MRTNSAIPYSMTRPFSSETEIALPPYVGNACNTNIKTVARRTRVNPCDCQLQHGARCPVGWGSDAANASRGKGGRDSAPRQQAEVS